jgi:hypothetical protein
MTYEVTTSILGHVGLIILQVFALYMFVSTLIDAKITKYHARAKEHLIKDITDLCESLNQRNLDMMSQLSKDIKKRVD